MNMFIILALTFTCLYVLRKIVLGIRDKRRVNRRKRSRKAIELLLNKLLEKGVLIDRNKKDNRESWCQYRVPYIGYLGSDTPEKVIVLQSGLHGLEYFSIETLLRYVHQLDVKNLEKRNIQVIVIPIVNYWGFQNYKRTNENGVDLARNYRVYTHNALEEVTSYPLVRGYKMWFVPWLLTKIMRKTWYYMGRELQLELYELRDIYAEILNTYSNVHFYDFHTGNNSMATTMWRHEFDTRRGIPKKFRSIFRKQMMDAPGIQLGPIDYVTYGGLYEGLSQEFKNAHPHLNAFTVEMAVLAKPGNWHYRYEYFFGSVFEPKISNRVSQLQQELKHMSLIINAEINAESDSDELDAA
ncbi:MAG: DUF2817 domain-containing protein [Candidatus Pacebacteria bacterium]|nr:DUF2817 domain-containing protein [Candidatus Paceibacterota bacterium]